MADLSVKIGGLQMKNPVMTASGTFGYGEEYADFVDLTQIGGIIVKGTTLHPREGNPYPRMAETPQGMLNAVGLQNKGVHYFVEHIYPRIKDIDTNMIVNVSGSAIEDYAETARIIDGLDRIREHLITKEVSIGDYVLTGGELAAAVMADAIVRIIPGVISDEQSALSDSFQDNLLAAPVYTRPADYKGWKVPDVLLSGHEAKIKEWELQQSLERTRRLRPDLLNEE